jgi:dipicolinate synthase subunit B
MIIAPCTGNTIAKLANGIYDTSVTMAIKSYLINDNPVVVGISTNDALSSNAKNIGILLNRKNYYFVPVRQYNPITKPYAITFDANYIIKTLEYALEGEQFQPIIL